MIEFQNVIFQYQGQREPALNQIDWCVPDGSIALVTGSSGSGKSTLARCINGLVPHFHGGRFGGRVVVAGLETTSWPTPTLSRHVGFVAQIPEHQTITDRVEDEVAFGVENLGLPRSELRVRVEEIIGMLGLAPLRNRPLETLSGGERQRAIIASALAMRPEVIVLDEPTSQLDPSSAEEILSLLRRLNDEIGTTVVLVEHRLDRTIGLADQLLTLDANGRILLDGPIRRVLSSLSPPPPLVEAACALGWSPLPLNVREARDLARRSNTSIARDWTPGARRTGTGEPLVAFEKVRFGYGGSPVLDRLSLEIPGGTVTAVMGRNGSGKTTLLKLVNGILRPASGRVRVEGRDIVRMSTADLARSIGYLPQNAGTLLFNDTVEQELRFTLRARGGDADVDALLATLGLSDLRNSNPLDLSGGERLRTALAAILIGNPRILLLDEPTRGVDADTKQHLGQIFRRLADDGAAVILATHDVDMVAEFADRVLILGNGDVVSDGSPYDVMPGSFAFSTQINRVFGGRLLTAHDVVAAIRAQEARQPRVH